MNKFKTTLMGVCAALALAGTANAANIPVNANIVASTTWTANNVYNLVGQIYVEPGATLTIEAGTVVASNPADQGSLAVCRGAKIFVNGTETNPVIMTSTLDTFNAWHEGANEWGNLTIMGNGLISASHFGGAQVVVNGVPNTKTPTGLNQKTMEGLTAGFPGDTKVLYGGNDDNDDSGSIHYLSLRYGGKVIGLANELNGLSLGAIGRETDIHHIDIMNNVDDGIEIWGGTVSLKYINIWNIGDDSFDVDQGWRGKAQFVLAVQGYAANAAQGSGVGDNVFETDGAEDSDAQPVTTATIYNATVIGQPIAGDHATAWRDNARVQYRNSVFMDLGERLVSFDNVDGDGAQGYGFNGTTTWPNTWTMPFSTTSAVNDCGGCAAGSFNHAGMLYTSQTSGTLAEVSDSVFFNNLHATAYTESNNRGVTVAGDDNPALNNIVAAASPIVSVTRGGAVVKGGLTLLPVTRLNPRAANDALVSFATAPGDGFLTTAPYRGAMSASDNWIDGWTAADKYGFNVPHVESTISLTGTTATVSFPSVNGVNYQVDSSTDMVNWSLLSNVVGDGSVKSVTDPVSTGEFYRVIIP